MVSSDSNPVGVGKAWAIWSAISFAVLMIVALTGGARSGGAMPLIGIWFTGLIALAFPQVRMHLSRSAKVVRAAGGAAGETLERATIKATVPDEPLYDAVAAELVKRDIKPGIWAKAFAEAQGDNEKAKAAYIRLRVAQLKNEYAANMQDMKRSGV